MIVRRSTLGGYWVDKERWPSVTEVQRSFPDPGHEYACQRVLLDRLRKFWDDAENHELPASCRETLELWRAKPTANSLVRWLRSDSGARWLAAAKTRQDNAWMDRGTLLHSFKDELARGTMFTDGDARQWLRDEIIAEAELSKLTALEFKQWREGERDEELEFKEWHDRYAHARPQRPYECEPEDVLPYLLALNGWWQDERPEVVGAERTLLDPRRKVVGRADGLLVWRGRLCMADFKSQKRAGPKDCNADQLGGYYGMSHYHDADTKELAPLEWREGMALIVFGVTPDKVCPYELKSPRKAVASFRRLLERSRQKGLFYTMAETHGRNRPREEPA